MLIDINDAVQRLIAGEVVAVPTDTVYGLAVLPKFAEKVYKMKKRPREKQLLRLVSGLQDVPLDRPALFDHLASIHWPGKLSIVIQGALGYRMPNQKELLEVLGSVGPVAAPSANPHGMEPALDWCELEEYFGKELPILSGEAGGVHVPSTIVEVSSAGWKLLRQGEVTLDLTAFPMS